MLPLAPKTLGTGTEPPRILGVALSQEGACLCCCGVTPSREAQESVAHTVRWNDQPRE